MGVLWRIAWIKAFAVFAVVMAAVFYVIAVAFCYSAAVEACDIARLVFQWEGDALFEFVPVLAAVIADFHFGV